MFLFRVWGNERFGDYVTYDEQRKTGAHMIIEAVHDLADAAGLQLTRLGFDGGKPIVWRDRHILTIGTKHTFVEVSLSDEALAGFPSQVDNDSSLAAIRRAIHELL